MVGYLPSPPVGEGGSARSAETDEGVRTRFAGGELKGPVDLSKGSNARGYAEGWDKTAT